MDDNWSQWGACFIGKIKHSSGAAAKLLQLIDKKGLESIVA